MTIEAGSGQDSGTARGVVATGGPGAPAPAARPDAGQRRLIIIGVELTALARYLGSSRFVRHVIVGAVGVAAATSLVRENQSRSIARLSAWDRSRQQREAAARARRQKKGT